jgi:hypothetical protein
MFHRFVLCGVLNRRAVLHDNAEQGTLLLSRWLEACRLSLRLWRRPVQYGGTKIRKGMI